MGMFMLIFNFVYFWKVMVRHHIQPYISGD